MRPPRERLSISLRRPRGSCRAGCYYLSRLVCFLRRLPATTLRFCWPLRRSFGSAPAQDHYYHIYLWLAPFWTRGHSRRRRPGADTRQALQFALLVSSPGRVVFTAEQAGRSESYRWVSAASRVPNVENVAFPMRFLIF